MAPLQTKLTVRGSFFRRALLRVALGLPSVTLNGGCSLVGYGEVAAFDESDASGDAGWDSDGDLSNDGSDSSSNEGSDGSADSDASFDAATDGSALDASDGSQDAAGDGGGDAADLDGSKAGGADSSTDGAAPQCDGGVCAPRCNLTGTYALKLTVPTTWPGTSQINGGSGTFEFRLRLRATHVDNAATIQLQQCGQTVPVVQAALVNENSLFTFPDRLFDSEVLPSASATMTFGDSTSSSSLSLPPVAMELGVKLNDPLNDAWPGSAAGLPSAKRVDVDSDGNPSITAIYSNASGYVYPRTSTSLVPQRAQQVYIAIRRVFSMTGMLTSCDGSQGKATVSKLDSRMLGCRHADGSSCSTSEANNMDTSLPKYQLSPGTYVLSRVADDASCQALRALP